MILFGKYQEFASLFKVPWTNLLVEYCLMVFFGCGHTRRFCLRYG